MRCLILSIVLLIGCQGVPITQRQVQSGGVGFTAGVVTAKTAQKVKEAFTPEFDIHIYPEKTCERIKLAIAPDPLVKCLIVPCAVEEQGEEAIKQHCMTIEKEDEFWEREKKVLSFDTSSLNLSVLENLCERYPKKCVEWLGKFKGKTILFVRKKK